MSKTRKLNTVVSDESQTEQLATNLSEAVKSTSALPLIVYLRGDLGAGKTTFSRSFIRGFGHEGNVKSPTYTLVEPYELDQLTIFHFDLYRLADPEELEFMGIRDYLDGDTVCLFEWPDKGAEYLAAPDITINIEHVEAHDHQRSFQISAESSKGANILVRMEETFA